LTGIANGLPTTVADVDDKQLSAGIDRIQAEIAVLFRRARLYFRDAAREVHPDLQPSAYAILVRLVVDGPMRASALVDYFATDKGAISRQISQLEHLGFATRTPDLDDKRAQLIKATPVGKRRCQAARERHTRVTRELLSHWDPADVDKLGELLARFNIRDPQ
jgi:DNA-binding MarR family transcriptional regulator